MSTRLAVLLVSLLLVGPATGQAFEPNNLFVSAFDASTDGASVFEFTFGTFTDQVEHVRTYSLTQGDFAQAYGLAFGPDGNLYAGDQNSGRIFRVTPGGVVTTFVDGVGGLSGVDGLIFGPGGLLYAGSRGTDELLAFDRAGELALSIPGVDGERPAAVTFGPDGSLLVSTNSLPRIVRHTPDGQRVGVFGEVELTDFPGNPTWGPDGQLFVADCEGNQIVVFDGTGEPSGPALGPPESSCPYGLAFGPDGRLYSADFAGNEVEVRDRSGALDQEISHPDMQLPAYVAFAPYRFVARLAGDVTGEDGFGPAKAVDKTATLSLSPGSGTLMLELADPEAQELLGSDWMVFHGFESFGADASKRRLSGTEVSGALGGSVSASLDLLVSGKLEKKLPSQEFADLRAFTVRSAKGTLHKRSAEFTAQLKITAKKQIKP